MQRHQGAKFEHFHVSNIMYHKFSLNGENVKVMVELLSLFFKYFPYIYFIRLFSGYKRCYSIRCGSFIVLLLYVHGKQLWSSRDGQLT